MKEIVKYPWGCKSAEDRVYKMFLNNDIIIKDKFFKLDDLERYLIQQYIKEVINDYISQFFFLDYITIYFNEGNFIIEGLYEYVYNLGNEKHDSEYVKKIFSNIKSNARTIDYYKFFNRYDSEERFLSEVITIRFTPIKIIKFLKEHKLYNNDKWWF